MIINNIKQSFNNIKKQKNKQNINFNLYFY